jgi:hypothetical protein
MTENVQVAVVDYYRYQYIRENLATDSKGKATYPVDTVRVKVIN